MIQAVKPRRMDDYDPRDSWMTLIRMDPKSRTWAKCQVPVSRAVRRQSIDWHRIFIGLAMAIFVIAFWGSILFVAALTLHH